MFLSIDKYIFFCFFFRHFFIFGIFSFLFLKNSFLFMWEAKIVNNNFKHQSFNLLIFPR